MGVKISQLPETTNVRAWDYTLLVQSGATKRMSFQTMIGDLGRYALIDPTSYTATPQSTSRIAMSDTSRMAIGAPLRYSYGGNTYYGLCVEVSENTYVDIAGAPLDTSISLTELSIGPPELVVGVRFVHPGNYADLPSSNATFAYLRKIWQQGRGHVVRFVATHYDSSNREYQPRINVTVNSNLVSPNLNNDGIIMGSFGQFIYNPQVAINVNTYTVNYGDLLQVIVTNEGSSPYASNLVAEVTVVLE